MNNDAQIEYWNGPAGQKWVDQSNHLDEMLAPFASKVLEVAALETGERPIDVGCGAGALSLSAADTAGTAIGVDVSEPLLSLARARANQTGSAARFVRADASTYETEQPYDVLVSRFGVMFFEDPIKAFSNLRDQMYPEGRMTFICWQALQRNAWAYAPLQAALPLLKEAPPQPDPHAPGPFAFADKDRIAEILANAGWVDVGIEPFTPPITLPGDDVASSAGFMLQLGPLSRLIAAQGLEAAPIEEALQKRLTANADAAGRISMHSACWVISAKVK